MMFRSSIFALIATAMTFAAEGVNITVNASVGSTLVYSVTVRAGNQTMGTVSPSAPASWIAWGIDTAYSATFRVAPGYEGRWTVTRSGQATLSGGEGDPITIPTTSYSGCTLTFSVQAKQYAVTLNPNGGSGSTSSVTATFGSGMPPITPPARTGYTFNGYWDDANGHDWAAPIEYKQYYTVAGTSASTWDLTIPLTLYAGWDANTYTVTLNQQEGGGGTASVEATYDAAMPTPITLPTRTGYTFGGYYTGTGGSGTQYYTDSGASAKAWGVAGNTTLYAKWTANKYTVTLDLQGGSGGKSSVTATYNATLPSLGTLPTRDGYTFRGYYSEPNGAGTQYYAPAGTPATYDMTSATTLYAYWTGITYAVTLDACDPRGNGMMTNEMGEAVSVLTNLVVVGTAWELPIPTNVNRNLTFAGWKYGAGQLAIGEVPLPSSGSTNLVAAWSDALAAAVDAPKLGFRTFATEGTGKPAEDPEYTDSNYSTEWFAQTNFVHGSTNAVQSGRLPVNTGDGHLYVSWLTTTVETNGVLSFWWKCDAQPLVAEPNAAGGRAGDTFRFGLYDPAGGITNEIARLTNHVDWCEFVYTNESDSAVSFAWAYAYADADYSNGGGTGWVDRVTWTPEGGWPPDDPLPPAIVEYTVNFDPNGGSGVMTAQTFTNGVEQALCSNAFIRLGYTFVGWATNSVGGLVYADGQVVTIDTNTVLYAAWTPNTYTVTFAANGGTGTMDNQTFKYDVVSCLSSNVFENADHAFAGWATNVTGEVVYADGEPVSNLASVDGGTVTLYAQWTGNVPDPTPEDNTDTSEQGNEGASEQGNVPASAVPQERTSLWTPVSSNGTVAYGGNVGDAVFAGELAEAYDGYLQDAAGNIVGTILIKAAKGKNAISKLTVTIQLVAEKKITVKGELDTRTGRFEAADNSGRVLSLLVGANSLSGTYGSYSIDGAQNKFTAKNAASKAIGSAVLEKCQGAITLAWISAQGWNGLSISIANKGKAKITGTLTDGTKVSAKGQLIVGESWSCIPVISAKKNVRLAFNVLLPNGAVATSASPLHVVGLDGAIVGKPGSLKGGAVFQVDAATLSSVLGQPLLPYLPNGLSVTGGEKWTLPKAGRVAYVTGSTTVDTEKTGENPSGLKLAYKAKDGTFKGSFKAYADVGGKPKATTVKVSGVVVDGIGYGAATVKKVGSGVPVKIE